MYEAPMVLIFLSGCNHPCEGLLIKLLFWVKLSPSHIPSTLVLRFIPVLKLPEPPGLPSAAPALDSLWLALCLLVACREHGPTQTGSQELNTAARLATGPLAAVAPPAGELSVGGTLPGILAGIGAGAAIGRTTAEQRIGELPLGHLRNEHAEGGGAVLLAIQPWWVSQNLGWRWRKGSSLQGWQLQARRGWGGHRRGHHLPAHG